MVSFQSAMFWSPDPKDGFGSDYITSACGPSLPICDVRSLVANGGKAEVLVTISNDASDPGCVKTHTPAKCG
jgi:hypothetical protein